jgi:hypothetical protein
MLKILVMLVFNLTAVVMYGLTIACIFKGLWLLAILLFIGGLSCTRFMYELANKANPEG